VNVRAVRLHNAFESERQTLQKGPYVDFFRAYGLTYDNVSPMAPSKTFGQPYSHQSSVIIAGNNTAANLHVWHIWPIPGHNLRNVEARRQQP
jgi:hypothetical protein